MANYKTLDSWSIKAKKEGYPARSVYKLQEIDEKFSVLKCGGYRSAPAASAAAAAQMKVLDLGCAPGSWSIFVLRKLAASVFLAACDLSAIDNEVAKAAFDDGNVFFLQGDMDKPENRAALCEKGPYHVVLCDAAPATTGNRFVDTECSLNLALSSLSYAQTSLVKGGAWVTKFFQGSSSASFLKSAAKEFKKFQTFKPKACRPNSFETYAVGIGKL
ncbi:MAG: RlmE family RNA methyltransferase [Termitinemataceae bacterium]|nr:MAG: RlmE family RNA methyltransferase [Termitinemataceae bacterium]